MNESQGGKDNLKVYSVYPEDIQSLELETYIWVSNQSQMLNLWASSGGAAVTPTACDAGPTWTVPGLNLEVSLDTPVAQVPIIQTDRR